MKIMNALHLFLKFKLELGNNAIQIRYDPVTNENCKLYKLMLICSCILSI